MKEGHQAAVTVILSYRCCCLNHQITCILRSSEVVKVKKIEGRLEEANRSKRDTGINVLPGNFPSLLPRCTLFCRLLNVFYI